MATEVVTKPQILVPLMHRLSGWLLLFNSFNLVVPSPEAKVPKPPLSQMGDPNKRHKLDLEVRQPNLLQALSSHIGHLQSLASR